MNRKPSKPPWPAETFAPLPLSPPTRILTRSDDAELRITHLQPLGLDIRIFRKSPNEAGGFEAFQPTNAGLVLPVAQAREFLGLLQELLEELDA
jgi:hypothetical protein